MKKGNIKLRPSIWHEQDYVVKKQLKKGFVAEAMGNEHLTWGAANPIFIAAPTGTGKNTYIENVVLPYAIGKNFEILIVSNRLALNLQTKRRIAKKLGIEKELKLLSDEGLAKKTDFKNVHIFTYQALHPALENRDNNGIWGKIKIVILDEAHFFVSDSTFNPTTGALLDNIVQTFQHAVRIYLTATPDEAFKKIAEVEMSKRNVLYEFQHPVWCHFHPKEIFYYYMPSDYSYLEVKYYKNLNQVLEYLTKTSMDEKAILFIQRKTDAEEIVQKLGKSAIFISADSKKSTGKDGNEWKKIVREEKFEGRFLVSTKVLDNGVNIKDNAVTRMVIDGFEKITFLQMLGRKRLVGEENFTLFIPLLTAKDINLKLNGIHQRLVAIYKFRKNRAGFIQEYLSSSEKLAVVEGLFFWKNEQLKLNHLGEYALHEQKRQLQRLLEELTQGNEYASILETLSWLKLEKTFSLENFLDFKPENDAFVTFIENNLNVKMDSEAFEKFGFRFKTLCVSKHGTQQGDRCDRPYKETKMRKLFEKYDYPYAVVVKNGMKEIVKK